MLRTKTSKALTRQKDGRPEGISKRYLSDVAISNRRHQWAKAKEAIEVGRSKFVKLQEDFKLQAMREKHQFELEQMKRKVDAELAHMQRKADVELFQMVREHEARMEVIRQTK